MSIIRYALLYRFLDFLTQLAMVAAAAYCVVGAVMPWGQATILQHIALHIPGALYRDGMIVIGAGLGVIAMRRYRLIGLIAAIVIFSACADAVAVIPRDLKSHIAAGQMALFPVNRLLDQANIPEIAFGSIALPSDAYLDIGIAWAQLGSRYLLAAAAAGLLFDPLVQRLWPRLGRIRCRACRFPIAVRRNPDYCPHCGVWRGAGPEPRRCLACRSTLRAEDRFCGRCGAEAAVGTEGAVG